MDINGLMKKKTKPSVAGTFVSRIRTTLGAVLKFGFLAAVVFWIFNTDPETIHLKLMGLAMVAALSWLVCRAFFTEYKGIGMGKDVHEPIFKAYKGYVDPRPHPLADPSCSVAEIYDRYDRENHSR